LKRRRGKDSFPPRLSSEPGAFFIVQNNGFHHDIFLCVCNALWCLSPHHPLLSPPTGFSQIVSFTFTPFVCLVLGLDLGYEQNHDVCLSESRLFCLMWSPFPCFPVNNIISFFLWLNNTPLCTYTTFPLSVHQLMGT
jgi:hypothetical protein